MRARGLVAWILVVNAIGCDKQPTEPTVGIPPPGVSPADVLNYEPSWSRDGSRVVYTHLAQDTGEEGLGLYQLWVYSFDTQTTRYLTEGHSSHWSPDGTRVAYVHLRRLWTFDVDAGQATPLSTLDDCYVPRWSPDGARIVFLHWGDSDRLWTIAPDGSGLRDLGVRAYTADWSPDGKRLVLGTASESALRTMDPDDTSTLTTLVDCAPSQARFPRWSPDGQVIAYSRFGGSTVVGLWTVDLAGATAPWIPNGAHPTWSPDGSEVVFAKADPASGKIDLWLMPAADPESARLLWEHNVNVAQ